MSDEMKEYVTFTVTTKDGQEVELAVVDEFEYKNKNYVAGALIVDDAVKDDEVYIYRVKAIEEEFAVEKINNRIDYENVCKAYMDMCGGILDWAGEVSCE